MNTETMVAPHVRTAFDVVGIYALVGVFISIFLFGVASLAAFKQFRIKPKDGMTTLRYGPLFLIAAVLAALSGGALGVCLLASAKAVDRWIACAVVIPICFVAPLSILLEIVFVRIRYDNDFIYASSPWSRFQKIRWDDLTSHSFSRARNCHILHTRDGRKIKINNNLAGLESLAEQLVERRIVVLKQHSDSLQS